MAGRSPARFLAPLALVGFVVALFVVVNGAGDDGGSEQHRRQARGDRHGDAHARSRRPRKRKRYMVKPGDTPSGIAEKTGVPLSQILESSTPISTRRRSPPGSEIKLRR